MKQEAAKPIAFTYECIPCAMGSLITLFKKGMVPEDKQDLIFRTLLKYFSELNYKQSPPEIGQQMHQIIKNLLNNPDPYAEIKIKFNRLLLDLYPELKKRITEAEDPFGFALRLAIAGNVIDFGPNNKFDIHDTIKKAKSVNLAVNNSQELKRSIARSKTLLYLGDNAGEVVMDRLFLETINHSNVYFAVRGAPIINDITEADAKFVGMNKIAKIISNGDDAPGTILKNTSDEFREIFESADLIISKGQGNYESLSNCQKNIFFILMAKCDHVAKHLGCKKGDFVVKGNPN